jgi:hypothetical protein
MNNWRPDRNVGANQTGLLGAISFSSVSVKDRSLLVPLVMLNACLIFSWPNKVYFDHEASSIIRVRIYTGVRIGAEGGMTGARRVSLGQARPDSWQLSGPWVLRPQFVPRRLLG